MRLHFINTLEKTIQQTRDSLARQEADLEAIKSSDLEAAFYSVSIDDPYDTMSSGGRYHICSVTNLKARGLQSAIELAEREYQIKSGGKLRTDGALTYRVYLVLPSGNISVPVDEWAAFTGQPRETLRHA